MCIDSILRPKDAGANGRIQLRRLYKLYVIYDMAV